MSPRTPSAAARPKPDGFARLQAAAKHLPGVEPGLSYGTPALKVKGKLFARLWEDGETLVLRVDFESRDAMLQSQPGRFFVTDHYRGYPAVLVRLPKVKDAELRTLLEDAWRFTAPKRLLAQRP
jgi:hypothetical protein